jgi:hypothetical protein
MVVPFVVAGAALLLAVLIARWLWRRSHRPEVRACVTEEEARENAAPLTTAIVSSPRRERNGNEPTAR